MQGSNAELFTGDVVNRTEESNCYETAIEGALSPDLIRNGEVCEGRALAVAFISKSFWLFDI
jgi:hypothetical protein